MDAHARTRRVTPEMQLAKILFQPRGILVGLVVTDGDHDILAIDESC